MVKRGCGNGSLGKVLAAFAQGPGFWSPASIQRAGMAAQAVEAEAEESLGFVG